MLVSVVIRTYDESRYLGELLQGLKDQQSDELRQEVIVVDSGSTDGTLDIADSHGARLVHIAKSEFSFGRSLNRGCAAASGEYLVFVSGHCIPASRHWLADLVAPLRSGQVTLTYGRQIGGPESKFSECQHFAKFFPATSRIPQDGFFCNNANAAVQRSAWEQFRFDEEITGLEDLHLARRLTAAGHRIGYVAEAAVYHHHHESWGTVRRRFERESIALQHIIPEIQMTFLDFLSYFTSAVWLDVRALLRERAAPPRLRRLPEIVLFRLMQFWGSYRGNHEHRQLSQRRKEAYFYPR